MANSAKSPDKQMSDRLLIDTAKKIAREQGCSGLRMRDIAEKAGVNLGMFHYHFGSKKRFVRVVLQEMYEEFFNKLTVASQSGKNAHEQLENTLFSMVTFIRDERRLFVAIYKDILNGDPEVLSFVKKNLPRHSGVIRALMIQCQKEGSIIDVPISQVMSFVQGGLQTASLIAGVLEQNSKSHTGVALGELRRHVLTDKAISQRIEFALKGLRP
jgi:AcrR family transcriptional regulator